MKNNLNLNDFFKENKITGKICNSPEDYAIVEKINREMQKVRRDAIVKFNDSKNMARHLILHSHVRGD